MRARLIIVFSKSKTALLKRTVVMGDSNTMNFELWLTREYYFAVLEIYDKIKTSRHRLKVVHNINKHVDFFRN